MAEYPTHVVLDKRDGHVFSRDSKGNSFTHDTAKDYVNTLNPALPKPYLIVCAIVPEFEPTVSVRKNYSRCACGVAISRYDSRCSVCRG